MSAASISTRKLRASGRRRFIDKILRRRLLLLSTTSASRALNLSQETEDTRLGLNGTPIDSTFLRMLGRSSLDLEAFIDDEIYDHDSTTDVEIHETMLDPNGDVFSNSSVERHAQRDVKVDFPGLNGSSTQDEAELPWSGLTYEALVFPKYLKANRKSNKSPRVFHNVFLAQELRCPQDDTGSSPAPQSDDDESLLDDKNSVLDESQHMDPNELLVMEFSRDGKYLAVAGRDSRITVWQVISSPLSRLQYRNYEAEHEFGKPSSKSKTKAYRSAPVFHLNPVRVFEGHKRSILSLSWSKNNFLISGSMDCTVKLWNVEREECLETFQHDDFVTCVAFHPTDDRFFISGSLDNCVRLWSILEASVSYSNDLGDDVLITALAFTPLGNYCVVGGFNGSLFALETNGLHVVHKLEVKERALSHPFHNKRTSKITGIKIFENPAATDISPNQFQKYNILVTTNDSKVRLIDLGLRKLVTRFKGSTNNSSSIVASLSGDNRYIITGSEDHWCYVWENNNSIINNKLRSAMKDFCLEGKNQISDKHKKISNLLHDNRIWKKLSLQKFLEDSNGHAYVANENNSYACLHAHHTKVNVALFAPEATKKLLEFSDDIIFDLVKRGPALEKVGIAISKNEKSSDSRPDIGQIIVTCDTTGLIRVFRQDPAYYVRKGLVEYRKSCKKDEAPEHCDVQAALKGLNKKSIKTRSLSPSLDRSNIKNKLQIKLKPNGRSPILTQSSSLLVPGLYNRSGAERPELTGNVVSSSSQVNLRDMSKTLPRVKDHSINYVTIPFHSDDEAHSISGDSGHFPSLEVEKPVETLQKPTEAKATVRKGRSRNTSHVSADFLRQPNDDDEAKILVNQVSDR